MTELIGTIVLMCVLVVCVWAFIIGAVKPSSFEDGYKQGQIDAKKGVQKILLLEFEDGVREYYHEDDINDFKPNIKYTIIK